MIDNISSNFTGAQPVAAIHSTVPSRAFGKVRDVSVRHFGSKKMLHLHSATESSICTQVLCHRNETMLSELKVRWREEGGNCAESVSSQPVYLYPINTCIRLPLHHLVVI